MGIEGPQVQDHDLGLETGQVLHHPLQACPGLRPEPGPADQDRGRSDCGGGCEPKQSLPPGALARCEHPDGRDEDREDRQHVARQRETEAQSGRHREPKGPARRPHDEQQRSVEAEQSDQVLGIVLRVGQELRERSQRESSQQRDLFAPGQLEDQSVENPQGGTRQEQIEEMKAELRFWLEKQCIGLGGEEHAERIEDELIAGNLVRWPVGCFLAEKNAAHHLEIPEARQIAFVLIPGNSVVVEAEQADEEEHRR